MAITVEELLAVCGRIPARNRRNTEVRVMTGSTGARTEVKECRVVTSNGQMQLRVVGMSPMDRARARARRHREETPVEPMLQVKFLRPGSTDRRKSNWQTVERGTGAGRIDMFLAGDAANIARDLVSQGATRHARTWDPVEARVVEEFTAPGAAGAAVRATVVTAEDAAWVRSGKGMENDLETLRDIAAIKQAKEKLKPARVRGKRAPAGETPLVLKERLREVAECDQGTQRLAARRLLKKAKAIQADASKALGVKPAPVVQDPHVWDDLLRRHPKKSGMFWLQVTDVSGAAYDKRRFEYKTVDGAMKGVTRLLIGVVAPYDSGYPLKVSVYVGMSRKFKVLACYRRADGEGGGVVVDTPTEKNLGLS